MAVAAIKYLHFTPLLAQSHNITLCQCHIAKFDIVQQRSGNLVWVPHLKDDVLPVLLDNAADMIEGLVQANRAKLPKRQMEHLDFFVRHVLRSCWKTCPSESYDDLFRRQRSHLAEQKEAVGQQQQPVCSSVHPLSRQLRGCRPHGPGCAQESQENGALTSCQKQRWLGSSTTI